jgi:hypothetical protein
VPDVASNFLGIVLGLIGAQLGLWFRAKLNARRAGPQQPMAKD